MRAPLHIIPRSVVLSAGACGPTVARRCQDGQEASALAGHVPVNHMVVWYASANTFSSLWSASNSRQSGLRR